MPGKLKRLDRSFYLQPTLVVARRLLGKYLVRRLNGTLLSGRIVEVEAYLGEKDPASHAYGGMTQRNTVMFEKGGHLYVYFTYGMHFCANVVTEGRGSGRAVLLRALEPVTGIENMAHNRGLDSSSTGTVFNLCSGPAKLCEAFAIRREQNGYDLCSDGIWLAQERDHPGPSRIARSTRVGITRGKEHLWRYYVAGSPFVSKGKPA